LKKDLDIPLPALTFVSHVFSLSRDENTQEGDMFPEALLPLCTKLDKLIKRMVRIIFYY